MESIKFKTFFDKILSSSPEVLQNCENSELFLYASCWILTREDGTRANHRTEYFNIFNRKGAKNATLYLSFLRQTI